MSSRRGLIGLGVGVAAAGVATAAGIATDRVVRARRRRPTPAEPPTDPKLEQDGQVVVADDGVPLYVEIDEPESVGAKDPGSPRSIGRVRAGSPGSIRRSEAGEKLPGVPERGRTSWGGVTVLLVHGYTHTHAVWSRQRAAFRNAGCRVVCVDLRGHGRSGEGDDASYTIAQLGRDLATVIEQTTPDGPIALVGHSMGGMALMALAEQRPDLIRARVIGVALISTSAGGLSDVNFGLGKKLGSVVHRVGPSAIERADRRPDLFNTARSVGRNVESALVQRLSFGGPVPRPVLRELAEMIFATRMHVIGAFMPTLMTHEQEGALAAFDGIETLILHGTRDRLTPITHGQRLAELLQGAELVVVKRAGHVLPMEDPELVNRELLAFLQRAERSAQEQ